MHGLGKGGMDDCLLAREIYSNVRYVHKKDTKVLILNACHVIFVLS